MVASQIIPTSVSSYLSTFGIHNDIDKTLTHRPVPSDNLYWSNANRYLEFQIRYLAIPFWLEICYRLKLATLNELLSDDLLMVIEAILHYSEAEEQNKITFDECMMSCSEIPLINNVLKNNDNLKNKLFDYLELYPEYASLRRGNFLAFFNLILCGDNEKEVFNMCDILIDLIICGCIIDDLNDVEEDLKAQQPNIVVELGTDFNGLKKLRHLFEVSSERICEIIPELRTFLTSTFHAYILKFAFQK